MQNIILALALLLFTNIQSIAQCDQKITWHSEKQETLTEQGQIGETRTDMLNIETTKDTVRVIPQAHNNPNPFIATIKETICEWKELFKDGRTTYKITFIAPNGRTGQGIIVIEGKNGKLNFYIELSRGKKIKMEISKYTVRA